MRALALAAACCCCCCFGALMAVASAAPSPFDPSAAALLQRRLGVDPGGAAVVILPDTDAEEAAAASAAPSGGRSDEAAHRVGEEEEEVTRGELLDLVWRQGALLMQLQAALADARAALGACEVRARLATDGSVEDVERARNGELRAEIERLVQTVERRDRRRAADAASAPSGDEAEEEDDADPRAPVSGPKYIAISSAEPLAVTVVDLSPEDQAAGECLVLTIRAPDLDTRLVLHCGEDG